MRKFERQLHGAPAQTIQLSAELLYAHLLIAHSSQMRGDTKRELIENVLSWSPVPVRIPVELAAALDFGLCHAGQSFHQHRPFLLMFMTEFVLRWKRLSQQERDQAIADPWAFKGFALSVPGHAARIQLQALLHLVHPDTFESIVSETHKQAIVECFSQPGDDAEEDVDKRLIKIRQRLVPEYGEDFTFYDANVEPSWRPPTAGEKRISTGLTEERGTAYWVEKTLVANRLHRQSGEWAFGRSISSPERGVDGRDIYRTMRDVRIGDVVLHFIDNQEFTAVSKVASGPETIPGGVPDTEWADRPAIRYELSDFTLLTPPITREELFEDDASRLRLQEVLGAHRGLFFNKHFELNQGAYLTAAPTPLLKLLNDIYKRKSGTDLPHVQFAGVLPEDTVPPPPDRHSLTLEWLEQQTLWPQERLLEIVDALQSSGPQIVLAGPPGTGKTWIARLIARYLTQDASGRIRLVQLHPSYSYEAFIEGLQPVAEDGSIHFRRVPGVVLEIAEAIRGDDKSFALIVDEMNRANLPRVFGELMYLLEYRNQPIALQYTKDFRLPPKLMFIGTMNTADRSIRSIDVALRRRFQIFECPPDPAVLARFYSTNESHVPSLLDGFVRLNEALERRLDRHHTIGHAFFMAPDLTADFLLRVWRRKIGPLIEEYFFDQPNTAKEFNPAEFWPELAE